MKHGVINGRRLQAREKRHQKLRTPEKSCIAKVFTQITNLGEDTNLRVDCVTLEEELDYSAYCGVRNVVVADSGRTTGMGDRGRTVDCDAGKVDGDVMSTEQRLRRQRKEEGQRGGIFADVKLRNEADHGERRQI